MSMDSDAHCDTCCHHGEAYPASLGRHRGNVTCGEGWGVIARRLVSRGYSALGLGLSLTARA